MKILENFYQLLYTLPVSIDYTNVNIKENVNTSKGGNFSEISFGSYVSKGLFVKEII